LRGSVFPEKPTAVPIAAIFAAATSSFACLRAATCAMRFIFCGDQWSVSSSG
jgi:hypothetical protein